MLDNYAAFLSMIAHGEGVDHVIDPATLQLADAYRVCFKGQHRPQHIIADLSTHPAVSGEWIGEPLDFLGAGYAGEISTAAGRYQIRKATFLELAAILHTSSFVASVQDDMGILLIKRNGALDLVRNGDIAGAIARCKRTWASLPGSNARQPQAEMAALVHAYESAGGVLA